MAWTYRLCLLLSILSYAALTSGISTPNDSSLSQRVLSPFPPGRSPELSNILIRYYNGKTTATRDTYPVRSASQGLLADERFVKDKPTVVYAHGYTELEMDKSIQTVIGAFISNGDYNVMLVDWSNLAYGDYPTCAANTEPAGEEVGKMIVQLLDGGLLLECLHLVGHSLGAHLMATTSRYLGNQGRTVPRLTGLDPALPRFYPELLIPRMKPTDAAFVDVIHTDGGGYGAPSSTGTLDFWPNGGVAKQPGCPKTTIKLTADNSCSHRYSWLIWSESVFGVLFPARQCNSTKQFNEGDCRQGIVAYMGLQASPEYSGNFYLRTTSQSPYSLGDEGAQPSST